VAATARSGDAGRWHGAGASARARDGSAASRAARGVRTAQRDPGSAQHLAEPGGRADRQPRRGGLLDIPAQRHRRAGGRSHARAQTRIAADETEGGRGVIKRRGRLHRGAIVFASAAGSIAELAHGLWHSGTHKRWMMPIAVFLCPTGLLLILATTVEALAPFIYSVF